MVIEPHPQFGKPPVYTFNKEGTDSLLVLGSMI